MDYAAATPMSQRAIDAMLPYFRDKFFNPSAPYQPAVEIRRDYQLAKSRIAQAIGARGDEIIITAGATESINLALNSFDGHIVTTAIEHHAVLSVAKARNHTLVPVDSRGRVSVEAVAAAITDETTIVSVGLANSEIGTIQPLREIAEIVGRERARRQQVSSKTPIFFHTDASQGAGQLDLSVARLGVDMMTVNASKVYGPKQVGLLWTAPPVKLRPVIVGGGQELGLRSGTENVAGVMGFEAALTEAVSHRKSTVENLTLLRNKLERLLIDAFPDAILSGHRRHRLASHLHISFAGLDAERLVFALETRGVYVATGSACAANKGTRSHVLTAIGLSDAEADGSLRLSLSGDLDEPAIDRAAEIIIDEVRREYERLETL